MNLGSMVGFELWPGLASSVRVYVAPKASAWSLCFVFNVVVLSFLLMFACTDVMIGQSTKRKKKMRKKMKFQFGVGRDSSMLVLPFKQFHIKPSSSADLSSS